jgi:hypothetical protein
MRLTWRRWSSRARLDDTIAIAALYRVLAARATIGRPQLQRRVFLAKRGRPTRDGSSPAWRYLYSHPEHNAGLDVVDRAIAVENKWRAQRYGAQGTFVRRSGGVAVGAILNQVLEMTAADAAALGCADEMQHCRTIMAEGTSADAQLRIFTECEHEGADIALHKAADWIRSATLMA